MFCVLNRYAVYVYFTSFLIFVITCDNFLPEQRSSNEGVQVTKRLYISVLEFSQLTGVSKSSILRQVKSGRIPSRAIGRRRLIPVWFLEGATEPARGGVDVGAN